MSILYRAVNEQNGETNNVQNQLNGEFGPVPDTARHYKVRLIISLAVIVLFQCTFIEYSCEYIKVTDVIEYSRRSTLIVTDLNTAHKRKSRSGLHHIVQNEPKDEMEARLEICFGFFEF